MTSLTEAVKSKQLTALLYNVLYKRICNVLVVIMGELSVGGKIK
jgi:hypothetical protein